MHAPAAARSGCKLRPLIAANAERLALLELRRERSEAWLNDFIWTSAPTHRATRNMSAKKNENCGKINEQVQEQPLRIDFCFGALYWLRIRRGSRSLLRKSASTLSLIVLNAAFIQKSLDLIYKLRIIRSRNKITWLIETIFGWLAVQSARCPPALRDSRCTFIATIILYRVEISKKPCLFNRNGSEVAKTEKCHSSSVCFGVKVASPSDLSAPFIIPVLVQLFRLA